MNKNKKNVKQKRSHSSKEAVLKELAKERKELDQQEKDFLGKLDSIRQRRLQIGMREENLSQHFLLSDIKIKRSKKADRERLECRKCNEVFLVDINGNRMLFEDQNNRFIVVGFKDFIALCTKCYESVVFTFDSNNIDFMIFENGKFIREDRAILEALKNRDDKDKISDFEFLKKKLLKLNK